MIIQETGEICDGFYVVGSPNVPVYLLDGDAPVLFDGGFTSFARWYETGIKEILGDRIPAYIFLTHSHFDHVGAVGYLKRIWPELRIGGSERCRGILARRAAVELIRDLNNEALENMKKMNFSDLHEEPFEVFDIDFIIEPDHEIKVEPGLSIEAVSTPGHTWDFISYWMPEKKILIGSEALACYESRGEIQPEFLVDYDAYLESLEKMDKLDARILCGGHHAVFTGSDVGKHIHASFNAMTEFLSMVEGFLEDERGNIDRTVSRVKAVQWDPRPWPKQPEQAYLLNTRQRVENILKRAKHRSGIDDRPYNT